MPMGNKREVCRRLLGNVFLHLRKKKEKKWPFFSLELILSGCDIWNSCSHLATSLKVKKEGRRAQARELQRSGGPFTMSRTTLTENSLLCERNFLIV